MWGVWSTWSAAEAANRRHPCQIKRSARYLQLEYLYSFLAEPSTQVGRHVMLLRSYLRILLQKHIEGRV